MDGRNLAGWLAVLVSAAVASIWAFWGAIEAFHEGWWHETLAQNLLGTLAYLGPMLIWTGLGLAALRFPRAGSTIYVGAGLLLGGWILSLLHERTSLAGTLLAVLMAGFGGATGLLWWFGRPRPKRAAYAAVGALPLLVALVSGAEPAWRVAGRVDDGDRGARIVEGNGVTLLWAPKGPGWPDHGMTWDEAARRCRHLTEDGRTLAGEPQDVWRLPTVDEIVRSLTRHGRNAGGAWDGGRRAATYRIRPDKETPLWDPHTEIIYWWAEEVDAERAWRVVYNGLALPIPKRLGMGTQAFRAVRDPQRPPGTRSAHGIMEAVTPERSISMSMQTRSLSACALALAMVGAAAAGGGDAPGEARRSCVYAQAAQGFSLKGTTLVLEKVASTLYFAGTPERRFGQFSNAEFVKLWKEEPQSFAASPPYAVLSFAAEGSDHVVLALSNPRVDGSGIAYEATVVSGAPPDKSVACTLFLDPSRAAAPAAKAPLNDRDRKARETVAAFKQKDPGIARFFETAAGWAVFPTIAKGGLIVGGARGDGVVYQKDEVIGYSTVTQGTIGLQIGGQGYSEIVFFEDDAALGHFKAGNAEFSAQASAVAVKAGAAANAKYADGVAVFTLVKGGLMAEASVGGQGFSFEPK
jgi:lipid-binding SYLF domain-containing protein